MLPGIRAASFGQKKRPSPFATAMVAAVLRPFHVLPAEVAALDVLAIGSSKGGSGQPIPSRPVAGRT